MDSQLAYSIVAFIQDRAASIDRLNKLPVLSFDGGPGLLEQVRDTNIDTPKNLNLNLSDVLDLLDVAPVTDDHSPIENIFRALALDPADIIRKLIGAKSPADVKEMLNQFFTSTLPGNVTTFTDTVRPLLQRQLGIALSFVTTLKNLGNVHFWENISAAHIQYFFGDNGFVTVDGIPILPPMHFGAAHLFDPATLHINLENIKGLLSEKTANRYVRDVIRVTVEAADDVRYDSLRSRFAKIPSTVGAAHTEKAVRWVKGISSLAESLVTSAVEEACLGVAQFQTNALIAASAGTYAGTAARKAAQHVFLRELGL